MNATLDLLMSWPLLVRVFFVASIVTFLMYGYDKLCATQGMRRTPENTLHLFSILGGWPGALAGQQIFNHKTRKQSFQSMFWATVAINLALVFVLIYLGVV